MAELGDYLKSINQNKQDVIKASGSEEAALRLYPRFPITRTLSYFNELVFLVNELNCAGLDQHAVDNRMHYDFLRLTVPKGNRFSRWTKAIPNPEAIEDIIKKYQCSKEVALEYLNVINELGE